MGRADRMYAFPTPDYETIPDFQQALAQVTDEIRAHALELFLPAFQQRYCRRLRARRPDHDVRIGAGDGVLRALQTEGCALTRLTEAHRAALRALTASEAEALEARFEAIPKPKLTDAQAALIQEQHQVLYELVEQALDSTGVFAVLNAYAGRPLTLNTVGLQINTARETARRYGEIDASGLPANRTSYFHIDSPDWPPLKILIYLDDVGLDQGPFRYVAGSHRMAGDFETIVRKTNDRLRLSTLHFMALPPPFRLNSQFGDYLDPERPEVAALLRAERTLCDGRSDVVLFNNDGLHRGGFVRRGRRRILQCTVCSPKKKGQRARAPTESLQPID